MKYPDCYLYVERLVDGHIWVDPIDPETPLNMRERISDWVTREFSGDLEVDGPLTQNWAGTYYACIKLDGEEPDSVRCWDSCGFYVRTSYE